MFWRQYLTRSLVLTAIIAFVLGMGLILSLEKIDRLTSTDAFCGNSCHVMEAYIAYEPVYLNSAHQATHSGVQAGCADCHIPEGIIAATLEHAVAGMRDGWSLLVNDFSTRALWNDRREQMAFRVRDKMLKNDSRTCRSCHKQEALKPRRERGQRQHELVKRKGMTCIACHYNLVHEPVKPRDDFLRRAGVWQAQAEK